MRTASRLQLWRDDVWTVEADAWDKGIHVRLRTPVVRLPDGGLWLYSPGPMDAEVAGAVAALGPVAHLVAPNKNHHLFLAAASERFPDARVWAPAGLAEKRPRLTIHETLPEEIPASTFGDVLEGLQLAGVPFTNEVVFFHRPTQALLCADLAHNFHDEASWTTRQMYKLMGCWKRFGQNRYFRFKTKDKAAFRGSMERVLAWEPEAVLMCHGDLVDHGGAALLRESLGWLGDMGA